MSYACPECPEEGTAPGIRRHRSAAHGYPSRAEFIDRFFDDRAAGTAREVLTWLEAEYPEGNWPYSEWNSRAVSRDLAQHQNYPRRWDITCEGRGPGAVWQRVGPHGEENSEGETDPELRMRLIELRDELAEIIESLTPRST